MLPNLASKVPNPAKARQRTKDGMRSLLNRKRFQSNNEKAKSHDLLSERSTMLLKDS
jgi:hypothetical protein